MKSDAFSQRHPAVNFAYFVGAIASVVVIQHPAYLLSAGITGAIYYRLLSGHGSWKRMLGMVPMLLAMTAINPLFNTYGDTVLFALWGRPYTREALLYGAAIAAIFGNMLLWFGCYNAVLTSDKFTSLFGNLIPGLSLLLVMVLRMIPNFIRKAKQITGARSAIGKGVPEQDSTRNKILEGMTALSALTSWALEGSVVTADSMRSRGYGCSKRTSFMLYTMGKSDWCLLVVAALLLAGTVALADLMATFTPVLSIAPVTGRNLLGLSCYTAYMLIPSALQIKETIQWHISVSRI